MNALSPQQKRSAPLPIVDADIATTHTIERVIDEALGAMESRLIQETRMHHGLPRVAKIVADFDETICHIEEHGSHHTDAIITEHRSNAQRFLRATDSASVMVNASTQFANGFEYGLGTEIGISTDKLHARGPVGLEGLTTQKICPFGGWKHTGLALFGSPRC